MREERVFKTLSIWQTPAQYWERGVEHTDLMSDSLEGYELCYAVTNNECANDFHLQPEVDFYTILMHEEESDA